jgi:hypothetical protein
MVGRKRVRLSRKRQRWDSEDWHRGWDMAQVLFQGAPGVVTRQLAFGHAQEMLDRGFADGDAFQFQLGLATLMDCCSEAIERGDCVQWW